MNDSRKRRGSVGMGNAASSAGSAPQMAGNQMTRGQFLKTAGIGAAAIGAAALGMSGAGRATGEPTVADACSDHYFGFDITVPNNSVLPIPIPQVGIVYFTVTHPNYDNVTLQYGNQMQCGNENLTSLCIPHYSYDIMFPTYPPGYPNPNWVNRLPETGFKTTDLDYFFGIMDYGVQFTGTVNPPIMPFPPTGLPGQPNWAQMWAVGVAQQAFLVLEHRNLGTLPFTSETQIPVPSSLGPEFAPLDNVYTPVGFDVYHPTLASPTNPTGNFKIFGYFFEGKGVWKYDKLTRPLVYIMNGITEYIEKQNEVTQGFRKLVAGFVNRGFDVLFIDKPGHGWSGGKVGSFSNKIFLDVLKQLDGKMNMKGTPLLDNPVKSTPIVLVGHSLGAFFHQMMMAVNQNPALIPFVNARPPPLLPFGSPFDVSTTDVGYKFKGVIDIEGLPAGWKFSSSGFQRLLTGGRILDLSLKLNLNSIPAVSEWVATVPKTSAQPGWPALMVVTTTQNYQSPEGALYAYNLANGMKKILILEGSHGKTMIGSNVELLKNHVVEFAADAVMNTNKVDTTQMTMQQLICSSPQIRTDVTPAPPTAGHLASYYAELKKAASSQQVEIQQQ